MKVVLLAPTPPPRGGIAGWTVRMLEATLKNNWGIILVDEKIIGDRDMFGDKNARKRNMSDEINRCFKIWSGLYKALKDEDARVVHSCIPAGTLSMMREYVCACITKIKKRKFIVHFRCTVPNIAVGKLSNFILKLLCKKCDLIMTLNEQTNEYLRKITDTPLVLIPNFISESEIFDSKVISDKIDTALYVGGVVETKGAYELIEVAQKNPDIQFRLVGSVDSAISEYVKNQDIKNLTFCGSLDKPTVKTELKNADVFMFLSYFEGEGFSNALCEAMAAGLPCVVTKWAANPDMIEDKGGVAVDIKNAEAASQALCSMQSPEVRRAQSDFNISKVKNCYIERVIIDKYVDAYESLL